MTTGKVINDLHYNGKTVNERLAFDGLLGRFTAAVQARDATELIELLEQVAIIKGWATRLATMILEGPSQLAIRLDLDDPRNAGVARVPNELRFPPCIRPVESPRDPYMHLGSHPEVVERVWEELGSVLPQDCRCIVLGTPGLVAPRSGILLAKAFGTTYILRIPLGSIDEAMRSGARTIMKWAGGSETDVQLEYGDDWIFGCWLKQEPEWLRAVYHNVEASGR